MGMGESGMQEGRLCDPREALLAERLLQACKCGVDGTGAELPALRWVPTCAPE